jgi:altronate hydrolase
MLLQRINMNMNIDFDCSSIDGEPGIAQAAKQPFGLLLAAASGRRSKSEQHGMGDNAFLRWQTGAVM